MSYQIAISLLYNGVKLPVQPFLITGSQLRGLELEAVKRCYQISRSLGLVGHRARTTVTSRSLPK